MHSSIKLETPCEFINITPVNPLISKCSIKVCYVGDEPNRNGSIITKETARDMAKSLPGSPIVGYFNESSKDFEEHNRSIDISNGKFEIKDTTKPYGFVDLNAKVWFQKFLDDGMNEHEYLMTEGYLWTGQYPECQRIVNKGNNQSMELDEKTLNADWTFDDNGMPQFFIINEAVISKLCILGENVEPCFEGANITKVQFSFEDGFKRQLFSMMQELTNLLNGGESQMFTTYAVEIGDSVWNSLYEGFGENYSIEAVCEEGEQKFAVLKSRENGDNFYRLNFSISEEGFTSDNELIDVTESYVPAEAAQFALEEVEAFESNFKKKEEKEEDKTDSEDKDNSEDKSEDEEKPAEDKADEEDSEEDKKKKEYECGKKKKNYELEEVVEYTELMNKYSELEASFNEIVAERDSLKAQNEELVNFKMATERTQKEDMINNTFYMLSDEDKADVISNIDKYSLDDIEAKLSIICVRNKVNFNLDEDHNNTPMTYSLEDHEEDTTPGWVKAVLETAKTL